MKDYVDIWTRWIAFLQSDLTTRKEVLDSLHLEVRQGFSIISKVSLEEVQHNFSNEGFFHTLESDLDTALQYAIWCGYTLFLMSEGIDPVEDNLISKSQTNELGNMWMEHYEKDKTNSLLVEIDPILSLFLQNVSQSQFNQLFVGKKIDISYEKASQLIAFLQWTAYQGYVFGMIEKKLNTNL